MRPGQGGKMSGIRHPEQIGIGMVADEPIRLAGLASIFDQARLPSQARLVPVAGKLRELLQQPVLKYLLIDAQSYISALKTLDTVRRARPDMRLIVIWPAATDEQVMKSIVCGARAYLDVSDSPDTVRKAVEVVTEGSIWARRRLLSQLIDRLLVAPEPTAAIAEPRLTARERQVLELILKARSNREIARQLGIEERTVRAHLARLMRKAGVDNRIKLSMSVLGNLLIKKDGEGKGQTAERVRK